MISVTDFLARVEQIAAEEPGYQLGHSGDDNQCDCIGLIIGAIRRAGGQWRGIHGSNYAARNELNGKIQRITGNSDLEAGEVVFKAREAGEGGNKLPDRYMPGGSDYNGDLRDYYHVGVVVSVYPLRIRHMTTPRPKMDTSIGKWAYHGWLKKVSKETEKDVMTVGKVIIQGGDHPESPINMRKAASTGSDIIERIPQGSEVELIEGGGAWNRISYAGKTGYVQSRFVHAADEDEMIMVSRKRMEALYDELGDLLGMRG